MRERVMRACMKCCVSAVATLLLSWSAPALASALQAEPQVMPPGDEPRMARELASFAGRPVVVNFWASWCEPCRTEMPALARLSERLAAQDVAVLTVAVSDRDSDAARFMREAGLSLPVLHDRDQRISRAWGARMLPYTVVLDSRHRIVARAQGVVEWDAAAVVERLRRLLE
jgi:thiol-disulfide isomerase/thioredoxin